MTPYLAIIGARFRTLLQYRVAAIAGVWTQVFFGFVLVMVYEAFYSSARAAPPMPFAQLVSYVWLGQALFAMLPWNIDAELRAMVRSGAVAYELCRPVDLHGLWLARALASRTAPVVMRAVPLTMFAALVLPAVGLGEWRLAPPPSIAAAVGFTAALACALVLGAAMSTLASVLMLWTIAADGIAMVWMTAVSLGSGLIVPLPLLPEAAQEVMRWLPFAGVFDLPFRIYTGGLAVDAVPAVLARQLGWAIVLIVLGRWLLARGLRGIVVQGG